jgi:hypothetical protein
LTFDVVYTETGTCAGPKYRLYFKITNSGGFALQSVETTVTDNDASPSQTVTYTKDVFEQLDSACAVAGTRNDLTASEVGHTTSAELDENPSGHDIDATIKVCTEDSLNGDCITKSINFTP